MKNTKIFCLNKNIFCKKQSLFRMEAFLQKQISTKSSISREKLEEIISELGSNATWSVLRKPGKQERYYEILGGILKKSKKGFAVKKHFQIRAYDGIHIGADSMDPFGFSIYEGSSSDSDTGSETDHITMHYGEDGHRQDYITLYGDEISDEDTDESPEGLAGYNTDTDSESEPEIQVRSRKDVMDRIAGPITEKYDPQDSMLNPSTETVDCEGELLDEHPEQVTREEMTRRPKPRPETYEPQLARAFHQADSLDFYRAPRKAQGDPQTWGDYFYVPSGSGEQTRENAAGLNPINEENKVDQLIRFGGKLYKLIPDFEPVNCNLNGTAFPQQWEGKKAKLAVPSKKIKLDVPMITSLSGQQPLKPDYQVSYRETAEGLPIDQPVVGGKRFFEPHQERINPNTLPKAGSSAAKRANFIYRTFL